MKIVISESKRIPNLGKLMYKNTVERVSDKMETYLKEMAQCGKISKMNYKLSARSYFGLLYSFVLSDKILNPDYDHFSIDQITDFAANIFEKGMTCER